MTLPQLQDRYIPPGIQVTSAQRDTKKLPRPLLRYDYPSVFFMPEVNRLPPHVYANYTVRSGAVASPRFVRFVSPYIGADYDTQQATGLPIGCVWHPLADVPLDESVELLSSPDISRCSACQAFLNPFCEVLSAGHRFRCNLCNTEQPTSSSVLKRAGPFPEREHGVYDIPVPVSLTTHDTRCIITICVDVSLLGVSFSLYHTVYTALRDSLDYLPTPENTYFLLLSFDSQLYIHLNTHGNGVKTVIVRDMEGLFIPQPLEELLFPATDLGFKQKLEFLMQAPRSEMTDFTLSIGSIVSCLSSTLPPGSRLILITSNLGTFGAYGLNPQVQSPFSSPQIDLNPLGNELSAAGITIDLYICAGKHADLVTLRPIVSLTGGDIHYFPHFNPTNDSGNVVFQLIRTLIRPFVREFHGKIRTSESVSVVRILGNYGRRGNVEVWVPVMDCEKTLTVVFGVDGK